MTDPISADAPPPDWEAFYRDYRKPGYVEGFEITSKLGGGMFGLVFRARRMSIGKDYAIKFLKVDDGEVRRAVLSELEQVNYFAQIDHPNLVSIEDRGEVNGIPFLVMAFAGTETLRDKMPVDAAGKGRVPTAEEKSELVLAFLQSCRGLLALHERSLVHFDIKPANVFLKGGTARLGDYGLSKLVTHSRGSLSMGRGTPYYMAPEMLKRRGDQRSDIYSLGVMLYEILCGRVPFTGDSEWEVLKKHETSAPELPAHLTAAERNALQRCLAKDPGDRFQSVAELLAAMGAPASAGAAAWTEVRPTGRDAGAAPAGSPPPPPSPPPSGTSSAAGAGDAAEEDPYREMARASRKAMLHAHRAARTAMREAGKTAREAARKARDAWHETWSGKPRQGPGHLATLMQRSRRNKDRGYDLDDDDLYDGPRRPGTIRLVLRGFGFAAVTVLVLLVAMAGFWFAGAPSSVHQAPSPMRTSPAMAQRSYSVAPIFQSFQIPQQWESLVSVREPDWARRYSRNKNDAKRLLLEHINQLRRQAPYGKQSRVRVSSMPKFNWKQGSAKAIALDNELTNILQQGGAQTRATRRYLSNGSLALAVAAEKLRGLSWADPQQRDQANRIHSMLRSATGCRDIELMSTKYGAEKYAEYNQPVGDLWLWFVNEFAHTERCWQTYRKLLRL